MRGRILVLFYHRINEKPVDLHHLCVSTGNFEQHMRYVKRNYPILRFEDDWMDIAQDSVVITFDDGYLDNYENAVPVLNALEIPATFFISSSCLDGNREFWWDELETILLSSKDIPGRFYLEDERYGCEWNTGSYEERKNCYWAIRSMMLQLTDRRRREAWMEQLWKWSGIPRWSREGNAAITKEICRKMAKFPNITIGCHTVSHPGLSRLTQEEQRREITGAKAELESLLRKEIVVMSYPHGMYDARTVQICKGAGLVKSATTKPALAEPEGDLYEIPRFGVKNWNLFEFRTQIEKMFSAQRL